MVPLCECVACREGHLFCAECVRAHAQEAAHGQGKAEVTCLEADCKDYFSMGKISSTAYMGLTLGGGGGGG